MQTFHIAMVAVVLFLCAVVNPVTAGELRFSAENINVTLYPPDTVEVTGVYFFTASDGSHRRQKVIYPVPLDSAAEYPFFFSVHRSGKTGEVTFDRIATGITFGIDVPKGDTATITVIYRQRFSGNAGRYILTTTSSWGRPLENSRYTIRIPASTTLTYLSYECDTVFMAGKNLIYSFYKKRFMPDRDLIFFWECADNISSE